MEFDESLQEIVVFGGAIGLGKGGNKRSLSLWELAMAMAIISVFLGVFFVFIRGVAINAKEAALQAELKSLRLAFDLYKVSRGSPPPDLKALLAARFNPSGSEEIIFGEKFLSSLGKDSEGFPIDPFGNRFYYDPAKEVVRSVTRGYENW